MAIFKKNGDIILTDETSISFVRNALFRNEFNAINRDALFRTLDQIIIIEHDGWFTAEIPNTEGLYEWTREVKDVKVKGHKK